MSDREKNLLYVLLAVLFLLGNGMAYKMVYEPRMKAAKEKLNIANGDYAEGLKANNDRVGAKPEIDWLARYEPKKASTAEQTQTTLEQLAKSVAQQQSLEVLTTNLLPSVVDSSLFYHRVKIDLRVTGMETGLYAWLDRLHSPNEFRAVTYMKVGPKKDDDTQIDCQVVVEQWFVPEGAPTS
jgi:hypothetical protein